MMTAPAAPLQVRDNSTEGALTQRPSFTRWNDPISRLPFLGHWLLSLFLLLVLPVISLWAVETLRIGQLLLPALLLACLPSVQLYWVSARRRILDIGTKTSWLILIAAFLAVCAFNALDGFMGAGISGANGPTLNRTVGALLMLPAVILHFVLLLRRGGSALHQP